MHRFTNVTVQAGYITWLAINVTFIRFSAGMKAQGLDRTRLLYHGPYQPFAAYYATAALIFLILVCPGRSAIYVGVPDRD